ncbi:hypothetical protein D2E43_06355 [Mycobacteroides abscessus]|nr:hypothetical protein D2E43_06355 [Mycobacteroides abscessus]
MPDLEPPLTPGERLLLASLYHRLTSLDVSHPRQHPGSEMNRQVGGSHILVSHHLSHNQSHEESV